MRIAINGIGVAGPTLAWWLKRYGHQPVLFEKADHLRTGGYVIDFWGIGYDVAEKMGLLPALLAKGYRIESLHMVNAHGKPVADISVAPIRDLVGNRFVSIPRSELAATIYHACDGVETHFGNSILGIDQQDAGVEVRLSNGATDHFDLVLGADGLHSQVRELAFGPESQFERRLGYYVSAFTLPGYQPREELVYVSHTVAKRHVARVALRENRTLFLFIFRAELLKSEPTNPFEERAALREVCRLMKWEVPSILSRLNETTDFYFDRVSQIHMDHWTNGRVALLGDAAACVSLLAGEGTGLGMTEAYVLAGELHQAGGDHVRAFQNYELKLRPLLAQKQKGALRFAGFFAPKNAWGVFLHDWGSKLFSIPFVAKRLLGSALHDDFALPEYPSA